MQGLSALLGALGGVGILFGLLSVFLGVLGAATDVSWILANLVGGALLLGGALYMSLDSLRERMASGESRRIGKYGSSAIAITVLSLALLGMAAFFSQSYHARFDWSESGVHSLSDQTRNLLAELDQDVEVLSLQNKLQQEPVRNLLERYSYESDRFTVEYADPTERVDLVERLDISRDKLAEGIVRIAIGAESVELQEVDEEKITNALVKLTRTHRLVYFLEGHGERPATGDGSEEERGFSRAADALRNENYRFESLLLAATGSVPEDADAVILAGPEGPFRPEERQALQAYLQSGGALLVLLDPMSRTNLLEDLKSWGVDLGDDVVVDRLQGLFGRAATPFARMYGDHAITSELREVTLFHMVRSVQAAESSDGAFIEIVKTGEESWGERDLELFFDEGRAERGPDDFVGPVPIAIAGTPRLPSAPDDDDASPAEDDLNDSEGAGDAGSEDEDASESAEPRLVVFGDADFAGNELIESYSNRDLFLNSVNWLLGDVESIAVRPAISRASRLELSTAQLSTIRYLSLFVLPETLAVLGVWAWWSRRRAPGR